MSVNEEDREHNRLWHLRKKRIEEQSREISEKAAEISGRHAEFEEILHTQKMILAELVWIREKLTYTVNP